VPEVLTVVRQQYLITHFIVTYTSRIE